MKLNLIQTMIFLPEPFVCVEYSDKISLIREVNKIKYFSIFCA